MNGLHWKQKYPWKNPKTSSREMNKWNCDSQMRILLLSYWMQGECSCWGSCSHNADFQALFPEILIQEEVVES